MNGAQQKVIASIYIRGDDLDPAAVTKLVGVQPSRTQRRGELMTTSTGRDYSPKIGLWCLSVEFDLLSVDQHLSRLLDQLPPEANFLAIPGVTDAYIDVFVAAASDPEGDSSCQLQLSPEIIAGMARYGLPARITFAVGPD